MNIPKVHNINAPIFLLPEKDYLFDSIPIYLFPQHGSSVMGIDFILSLGKK